MRNRRASAWSSQFYQGDNIDGQNMKPNWRLSFPESVWTDEQSTMFMFSANVTADRDGGLAAKIIMNGQFSGGEGKKVFLYAGYGDELDIVFQGRIDSVKTNTNEAPYSELSCYGQSHQAGNATAMQALNFNGMNLKAAMDYVNNYSEIWEPGTTDRIGDYFMYGGEEYTIHNPDEMPEEDQSSQPGYGEFMSEATLTEIERTLLEPTGYSSYDNPRGHVIHPTPEIRRNGDPVNYVWWWTPDIQPDDYPQNGFDFTSGTKGIYNWVIVFRRAQDADLVLPEATATEPGRAREVFEVYSERLIDRQGMWTPYSYTNHIVADFNGTQEQADAEAERLATDLATIKGTFSLTSSLRVWWLYDVFYLYRYEQMPNPNLEIMTGVPVPYSESGYAKVLYACLIESYEQTIAPGTFVSTVSGTAAIRAIDAVPNTTEETYGETGLIPMAA